ncbi:hypothetical protein Vretimale_6835 [Volvox reticuliferus]|uniref:Uncharacterized protein n=1 Tax=Volvox reticuliferus TaxID=1737510 RepID=A0A8J4C8I4_9CHLO|nr:hypothetical protein Vretifemale_7105 [Volvox reticuliferus]GIM02129.1 hypothetical protein Vretimale_6835 [Volvox reticuliferus]
MSKAKKQRIVYKQDAKAKAAELEEFLFGAGGNPISLFDREKEEAEETVAELVKQASRKGGLLHDSDIFFQDTRGAAGSGSSGGSSSSSSSEEEEEEEGNEEEEEEEAKDNEQRTDATDDMQEVVEAREEGEEEEEAAGRSAGVAGKARGSTVSSRGGTGGDRGGGKGGRRAPVWNDPDDVNLQVDVAGAARLRKLRSNEKQTTMDGVEYEAALRRQHQILNPRTSWAKKPVARGNATDGGDEDEDEDEAAALLARAGGLVERPVGRPLPAGQIETTRLKDANQHQPSDAVVQSVKFHPNGQVLLTAGLDKKLRLFQVDGLRNPLIQSVHLDEMPIVHAEFAAVNGSSGGDAAAEAADRVVLAGRRPFFYVFDLGAARIERVMGPTGYTQKSLEKFTVSPPGATSRGPSSEPLAAFTADGGFIPLVSLRSRQWVANLKMSGNVRALAFSHDGVELFSTGDDGIVHVWDLRTRRCRLAFTDMGNIGDASTLTLSADGRFIATGAKSGVVNVYRRVEVEAAAARAATVGGGGALGRVSVAPERELLNLTTNVDTLVFSPDSQMLLMASRMKRNSLRLVHLPSLTVFANWPTSSTPLHYVNCADFSPHCGMLTIGNAKGRALLYRLHHYQQA